MRTLLLLVLLIPLVGCRCWKDCQPCQEKECAVGAPCATVGGPCQPETAAPVKQAPPAVRSAPLTKAQEQVERRIDKTETTTAVAQDILLVPKTVYMPYVAQVPVTTARISSQTQILSGVEQGGTITTTTTRGAEVVNSASVSSSSDESLTGTLRLLREKLSELETRQQQQMQQLQMQQLQRQQQMQPIQPMHPMQPMPMQPLPMPSAPSHPVPGQQNMQPDGQGVQWMTTPPSPSSGGGWLVVPTSAAR